MLEHAERDTDLKLRSERAGAWVLSKPRRSRNFKHRLQTPNTCMGSSPT